MAEPVEMQRSSRSPEVVRARLEEWLRGKHADAAITDLQGTAANGMSSDTVLFDATWDGAPHELVARLAPDAADVPVFASYDLTRQFQVIRAVAEQTEVPVPAPYWDEPSAEPLGAPFFVMGRVDGQVPPDVMPYNFGDSWLFDAAPDDQRTLQDATTDVLAQLHAMPQPPPAFLEFAEPGDTAMRRHLAHTRTWYEYVTADCGASPLLEQVFELLLRQWPAEESASVVSWGDARIGNVIYRDFRPVAVLDWEMCGVGPRELDLAWFIHAHRVFEDLATMLGMPGMPHFMRREDVVERYTAASGYTPRDLDFYETYAALQWGIVYLRTGTRQVRFGEREMPADVDELLYNREPLQRILEGTYF